MSKKKDLIIKRTVPIGQTKSTSKKVEPTAFRDLIPKSLRNILPGLSDIEEKNKYRPKERRRIARMNAMTRTFAPLGLTEDGEIKHQKHKFHCKGLNQARFNALVGALRLGATIKVACDLAGIHQSTYCNWMRWGAEGKKPYTYVYLAFRQAEAELNMELLDGIKKAGLEDEDYCEVTLERNKFTGEVQVKRIQSKRRTKQWNAAAWLLERSNPDYRLNNDAIGGAEEQTLDEDLYMIDALSSGRATKIEKDIPEEDANE